MKTQQINKDEFVLNLLYDIESFMKKYKKENFINIMMSFDDYNEFLDKLGKKVLTNTDELIDELTKYLKDINDDQLSFECINIISDLNKLKELKYDKQK